MKDAREQNRLANVYRKECRGVITSPFVQSQYIAMRLKGVPKDQALEQLKTNKGKETT